MSKESNVQVVKEFFAALSAGDEAQLMKLVAEDIEWIIPGKDTPLAGTHRGYAAMKATVKKASEEIEMTYPAPPEFVAQGDRVLVIGTATGKLKATNKWFDDQWIFDITLNNGKLTRIQEYIDTQALANAATPNSTTSL